jgi:Protein of unknown function (DUF2938)
LSGAFILLLRVLAIGVGATATMDMVAILTHRFLGMALPDYALVARWIGHMSHGQFRHAPITKAPPIPRERALGWFVHYTTGVGYAVVLLAIWGLDWLRNPTILPPLILSLAALAIPFLIMQPAFGLGIAASKHPHPRAARLRSLTAHSAFGVGLYLAALASLQVIPV